MEVENSDVNQSTGAERQRDRTRRSERGSRFSDVDVGDRLRDRSRDGRGGNTDGGDKQPTKRVYVSNIPYTFRWQELKDLFRRDVGPVDFAEIYMNDNNKSRGCGIVEFSNPADAERAVEQMHRYELDGRQLVVRLDFEEKHHSNNRSIRESGIHVGNDRSRNTGGHDDLRYPLVIDFNIIRIRMLLYSSLQWYSSQ